MKDKHIGSELKMLKRQVRKISKLAIIICMTLQVGSCVTFSDLIDNFSEYVGIVVEVKEVMHLEVVKVLWNDGSFTTTSAASLKLL